MLAGGWLTAAAVAVAGTIVAALVVRWWRGGWRLWSVPGWPAPVVGAGVELVLEQAETMRTALAMAALDACLTWDESSSSPSACRCLRDEPLPQRSVALSSPGKGQIMKPLPCQAHLAPLQRERFARLCGHVLLHHRELATALQIDGDEPGLGPQVDNLADDAQRRRLVSGRACLSTGRDADLLGPDAVACRLLAKDVLRGVARARRSHVPT